MKESWRPIPGFKGYEASDCGRIRSYKKSGGGMVEYPHFLKPSCQNGYAGVNLSVDSVTTFHRVHKLVMLSFVGERPYGMQICHNDSNSANNRLSNLRYDSIGGNMADRVALTHKRIVGMRVRYASGDSDVEIAKDYNVKVVYVRSVCAGNHYIEAGGPLTKRKKKISDTDVLELRKRAKCGEVLHSLAKEYGISYSYASLITRGLRRKL